MITIDYEKYIDKNFQLFSQSLIKDNTHPILGVRMPILKEIAKHYTLDFVNIRYVEDILIQCLLIGKSRDCFKNKLVYLDYIIPYFSSWLETDCLSQNLKIKKTELQNVFDYAVKLTYSEKPYFIRTGVVILLSHFLTDQYFYYTLNTLDRISLSESRYPIQMAIAWAYSVSVVKYKEETIKRLCGLKNKTILKMTAQKCRDSKRVDEKTKERINNFC